MPENNSILEKLEGLESRYEEVATLITDPSVISDQERYVRLTREYKDLDEIMKARKRYIACINSINEAKDILANESDPDLREMAREELQANEELQPKIEEEIKIALVPKDPEDAKNVQMEIRAGTGGDEAALFAGDLFQMYKKYCDSKGWSLSVTSVSEGAVGGYKEIDFAVSGDNVYGILKYEGNGTCSELSIDHTPYIIGSELDCDGVIPSGTVSRHHARITRKGEVYFIEDLNSSNGTLVGGELLNCRVKMSLQAQETVMFADEKFRFI